jgi:hypothetical protein
MAELKLIALDAEDLAVISAHLQDAVLQVGDMAYLPHHKRFAAIGNRFDWVGAIRHENSKTDGYARRRAALRFERVLGARLQGIDLQRKTAVLSLLAISFEPGSAPEGTVTLHFADGAAIQLHVECIEAEMQDLGPVWRTQSMPQHPDDASGQAIKS